jgi:hypothetical protein
MNAELDAADEYGGDYNLSDLYGGGPEDIQMGQAFGLDTGTGIGGILEGFGPGEQFGPQKSDGGVAVYGTDKEGNWGYLGQENVVGPNPGYGFGGYGLARHLAERDAIDRSYDDLGAISDKDEDSGFLSGTGGIAALLLTLASGGAALPITAKGLLGSLGVNALYTGTVGKTEFGKDLEAGLDKITDPISDAIGAITDPISSAVGDAWDAVTAPVSKGWESLMEALENDEPVSPDWSDYSDRGTSDSGDEDNRLQRTIKIAQALNDQANIDPEPEVSSNRVSDMVDLIDRKNWYRRYQEAEGEPIFGGTQFAGPAYYEEIA